MRLGADLGAEQLGVVARGARGGEEQVGSECTRGLAGAGALGAGEQVGVDGRGDRGLELGDGAAALGSLEYMPYVCDPWPTREGLSMIMEALVMAGKIAKVSHIKLTCSG